MSSNSDFLLLHIPTGARILLEAVDKRKGNNEICPSCRCFEAVSEGLQCGHCPFHHRVTYSKFAKPEFMSLFLVYSPDFCGELQLLRGRGIRGYTTFKECLAEEFLNQFPWYNNTAI